MARVRNIPNGVREKSKREVKLNSFIFIVALHDLLRTACAICEQRRTIVSASVDPNFKKALSRTSENRRDPDNGVRLIVFVCSHIREYVV